MFFAYRIIRLFSKSLYRIAVALEELRDLYKLELATRGIVPVNASLNDEVEISYGMRPVDD